MPVISKLLQAHYQINKSRSIHQVRLLTYNRIYTDKDLVRVWLPKWVTEADVEPDEKAKLGKLFVKRYMEYCPVETMRCIVSLAEKIAPLLPNRFASERFLMRALRKAADPLRSGYLSCSPFSPFLHPFSLSPSFSSPPYLFLFRNLLIALF